MLRTPWSPRSRSRTEAPAACGFACVLLTAGCASLPAVAARLGGGTPALLLADELAQTGSDGQVVNLTLQARLRSAGSTRDGLAAAWSAALDQPLALPALQLAPVPWRDPPLSTATTGGLFPNRAAAIASDTPATRIARLTQQAQAYTSAAAPGLAARLAAALAAAGVAEGWFNYRQMLPVGGALRTLTWTLHANAAGTWFAGSPAISAPGTAALHVSYTPLTLAAGLPQSYRYADGGWLHWTLDDGLGHPLPGAGARNTGGAFDGPTGLACLLGTSSAACPAGQTTIPDLMETLGAAEADLALVSALQPVYAKTPGGIRYAMASLVIDRYLQGGDPACIDPPWRFTNVFSAAFVLSARVDHYRRRSDGRWDLEAGQAAVMDGPLAPWRTLSLALVTGDPQALAGFAIDPDRDILISLGMFPAGIQQISASPVRCATPPAGTSAHAQATP